MTPYHDTSPEPNGIVLVDKPKGMTSFDVVARMRRVAGTKAVGHTGTLDPMAEGLLIVCIGGATRVSQFLVGLDKVYVGTITLGAISTTYDAEGDITPQGRALPGEVANSDSADDADQADDSNTEDALTVVKRQMRSQVGERIQLPPPYSAIKVGGKKLYEYARNGEEVPQKPRHVSIQRFDLVRYLAPEIHFEARVGSGTYIRSMAHDLGIALGCGGYLSRLRRTRIGAFSDDAAVPLETLMAEPALLGAHLMNVSEALGHLPKITIQGAMRSAVTHGRSFSTRDILDFDGILTPGRPVLVLSPSGEALSIVAGEVFAAHASGEDVAASNNVAADADAAALGDTPLVFKPLRVLAQP